MEPLLSRLALIGRAHVEKVHLNNLCKTIAWIFASILALSCLPCATIVAEHYRPVVPIGDPDPARVHYWETVLPARPEGVGPVIGDRATWQTIAARPEYHSVIADAERFSKEPFPPLPDPLFLTYS